MSEELDKLQFVHDFLERTKSVTLLVVAESSGSSPGRAGYKMAVAADGDLFGSIGGGVMEVNLVEWSRAILSEPGAVATGFLVEQVHRRNAENASGMICSGRQTVILKQLTAEDLPTVERIVTNLELHSTAAFEISNLGFQIVERTSNSEQTFFKRDGEDFVYQEMLGQRDELIIIGGGHCALALSELAAKLGFRISIFDDRPELNTIAKNEFADRVTIIDSYENIGEHLPQGDDVYVVVMTLGYASDAVVIRQLIDHEFKYFGVLGSKAKMATLMKELRDEGFDQDKLARIHTPIGLPINSRTPEEIAVSIAAEIIKVRNA